MAFILSDDPNLEVLPFPVRRWSVEEYELFARLGILDEDDQLELLDGWIVPKMTKNPLHDAIVDEIRRLLSSLVPAGWYVRTQNVLLTSDSAPEPDVVLVRGVPRDYLQRHPTAQDVALVVEVADSSLERDRLKASIYSRAGVAASWIVNLVENQIELFEVPTGTVRRAVYDHQSIVRSGSRTKCQLPGGLPIEIAVEELLP